MRCQRVLLFESLGRIVLHHFGWMAMYSVHCTLLFEGKGGTDGGDGHVAAPCHRVMLGNEGRRKEKSRADHSSNIGLLSSFLNRVKL